MYLLTSLWRVNRYPEMSKALMKAGRPIYFSLCEWYVATDDVTVLSNLTLND